MENIGSQTWWLGIVLGGVPLLVWLLCSSWNEIRFLAPLKARYGFAAKLPPGHMGLPFFGEMIGFLWYFKIIRRPDDFIESKRQRYGGVGMYRTHLFGSPAIITCSPALNKFVLQSDLFTVKWPSPELMGHNSLVVVNGKAHTRVRGYVYNAINSPEALKRITQLVQPRLVLSLRSWAEEGTVNALDDIKKVTFANIGKIFASFEPGPLLDLLDGYFVGLLGGMRAQRINFPGSAYHHALKCRKKLTEIFRKELENRLKESRSDIKENNDLMDGLIRMKDEQGKQLSNEEVLDNIVSLVLAGYESTSLASMWGLYYLAKYPEVLRKLREENIAVSQSKEGDFITSKDLAQLKYTNKVVEETIRMANVAPFLFRRATEDVDYQGYKIPKDWRVIVWLRCLHTDPKNFKDPMSFNPDRWNEPAKPGAFQVFGGGRRMCLGNMLARVQISIFLHHLSIGYKWELINPDAKVIYLPNPRPEDGVKIKFSTI
ncbi:Cytochrome P450 [Macleaya cordata]|uniref:Cytochrome P450 n=1 Tax=Macleaya cordata TaxID=56857 RepID=A0A200QF36_MACCD|nr:Cytochrome P450 [Macleaya cordata]